MAQQTRTTLKTYFETGDTPTQAQFEDLIDSNFNLTDNDSDNITEGATNLFLTSAERSKLSGVEAGADVTDTANVTAAGALMDSEITNLAQVKAFDSSDYATAAQGATADSALPLAGGTMTGAINGDQDIRGRRPQGETLETSTPEYEGQYINQFFQVNGDVDFNLIASPSGVSAGDVTEFLLIATSGRIRFAIEEVTLYVTNLGRFTSGEFECTGAGDAVVLRYLGSDTYQLTGNNISQV